MKHQEGLTEKQVNLLQRFKAQTERLADLVGGILDLRELENKKDETFSFADADIHQVLGEVISLQKTAAENKGCYLNYEPDSEIQHVKMDRPRMIQIVTNLINNAIKYTPSGGVTVKSKLHQDENAYAIEVHDTGPGISEEDLAKLFQKFQRLDNAYQSDIAGSGLGLYITRELVDKHKGRIEVTSELGKGSCFRAIFPANPS